MSSAILAAFGLVFDPYVLTVILLSAIFGLFVGAMPGLTATMATALLVPVTFFMSPVPALGAIVTATAMAIFAGDIPAAMLRMPGTPASAAYTDESYAMSRKGQLELNLGVNLVFSVLGGLIGVLVLILAAPSLAELAINFSSFEYFWLACLGLTCAIFISTGDPVKGFLSLFVGLAIGCIGIDPAAGYPRFTFGNVDLMSGINFIPTMIGVFAVSELMRGVMTVDQAGRPVQEKVGALFRGLGEVTRKYWTNFLRGSAVGTLIGALPGAGADIAAWVSYAMAKRFSKEPEKFGTGHIEGIVESTSANNSAIGGAWIPALVFGIPGDSITAIVIGVLYMKGMNPGPTVFLENPQLIYAVFIIFILANLLMLPLGYAAIRGARHLLAIPKNVLLP
ncbi:MAG: tripartite tricarboxylate transporter permease, partial [Azospirillum sp.]|nr:tripartite tricarboxylate transporter permease [Azospirillum sp.]